MLWSFKPSIEGFEHCCPVLSIDGTHLYRKYKGTLLIVMGCDKNNQLFSLAFAILQKARILIVGDGSWHISEIENSMDGDLCYI